MHASVDSTYCVVCGDSILLISVQKSIGELVTLEMDNREFFFPHRDHLSFSPDPITFVLFFVSLNRLVGLAKLTATKAS